MGQSGLTSEVDAGAVGLNGKFEILPDQPLPASGGNKKAWVNPATKKAKVMPSESASLKCRWARKKCS